MNGLFKINQQFFDALCNSNIKEFLCFHISNNSFDKDCKSINFENAEKWKCLYRINFRFINNKIYKEFMKSILSKCRNLTHVLLNGTLYNNDFSLVDYFPKNVSLSIKIIEFESLNINEIVNILNLFPCNHYFDKLSINSPLWNINQNICESLINIMYKTSDMTLPFFENDSLKIFIEYLKNEKISIINSCKMEDITVCSNSTFVIDNQIIQYVNENKNFLWRILGIRSIGFDIILDDNININNQLTQLIEQTFNQCVVKESHAQNFIIFSVDTYSHDTDNTENDKEQ